MGSYDQDEALRATLPALAAEVAPLLGDGWTSGGEHGWGAIIDGPDGAQIFMRVDRHSNGKVTIDGNYPHEFAPRRSDDPAICVSVSRGAAAVAREITRRLLPAYLPLLAEAQQRQRAHEDAQARQRATVERITGEFPALEPWREQTNLNDYAAGRSVCAKVNHDGSAVTLELSVTTEKALAILRVLYA